MKNEQEITRRNGQTGRSNEERPMAPIHNMNRGKHELIVAGRLLRATSVPARGVTCCAFEVTPSSQHPRRRFDEALESRYQLGAVGAVMMARRSKLLSIGSVLLLSSCLAKQSGEQQQQPRKPRGRGRPPRGA